MSSVVFFDNEPAIQTDLLRVGLAVNNPALETWFEKELCQSGLAQVTQKISSAEESIDHIDAIIILRKNRSGGVADPYLVAKKFIANTPGGIILFIAGLMDDQGKTMIKQMESLDCNLIVAAVKQGTLEEDIVIQKIQEFLELQKKSSSNVFSVFSAKGGCGATTFVAHIANHLSNQGSVLILESRESLRFHQLNAGIEVLTKAYISAGELEDFKQSYPFIVLDMDNPNLDRVKKICILDGSPESIHNAKVLSADHYVLNQACTALPKEVIEHELGKPLTMSVESDREAFLKGAITGEPQIFSIEKLV